MTDTLDRDDIQLSSVTPAARVAMLAEQHPHHPAITFVKTTGSVQVLTWVGLAAAADRAARVLAARGVGEDSTVVIGLPNSPAHLVATLAAWRLGAMVLPLNARLPVAERDALLTLTTRSVVVTEWTGLDSLAVIRPDELEQATGLPDGADLDRPLPDRVAHPGKAIASGGSTGRPKIIVDPDPYTWPPDALAEQVRIWAGVAGGETQLVAGPLYHNLPFGFAHLGLFLDHHLVMMERFDAAAALRLIEQHGVTFAPLVPTMMQRMLAVPDVRERDLSSLRSVFHTAAPCPPQVKRGWIDLVGAEKVYELYGATEAIGACTIRGDDWLDHPGSVGRPIPDTELCILDESGREVPTGEVGEVFMRRPELGVTYRYVGSSPANTTGDGFVSVGDLGRVDEDGYLYLADRRADLIITGGANVYPAEVEHALIEHPGVLDVAVVGLASEEWGKTVHAVVEPRDGRELPSVEDLRRHCRERLASYKVPKSFEFVDRLPRNEAGKVRRSALAAARAPSGGSNGDGAKGRSARQDRDDGPRGRWVGWRIWAGVAVVVAVLAGVSFLIAGDDGDGDAGVPGGLVVSSPGERMAGVDFSGQPSRGPDDAPVVMVEFVDYSCEFCARHHVEVFDELLRRNAETVRYIMVNYPVSSIHPLAGTAAEAAECAHAQGGFWEYHDWLLRNQGSHGVADLERAARGVGLDGNEFDTCLGSGKKAADVLADQGIAGSLDVQGTPTFFVNGLKIEGAKPIEEFQAHIDAAIEAARA